MPESRSSGEFKGSLNIVPNTSEDVKGGDPVNYNENGECIFGYGFHTTRGRRPANEDRMAVTPCMDGNSSINFYGVFDGHQGDRAAELRSKELPRQILLGVRAKGGSMSELDALDLFADAYKAVDAQLPDMDDGTSACAALVCKETLFVGSVGDSQALLCRLNTPVILNQPHKMTDPREKKRIEAKGGSIQIVDGVERVNGVLNMSRALGNHKFRQYGVISEPSVTSRSLSKGDNFLLIATDGLWNFVTPPQACQVMSSVTSAEEAATTLVNLALQQGSTDNVSVVVVDLRPLFGGAGFERSSAVPFNLPQAVKSMADNLLEKVDLFQLPPDYSGWLLKESRGNSLLGKRWQKRYFVLQSVTDNIFAKDSSVLNATGGMKVFVLTYHESEKASRKQNPAKVSVVDPTVAVVREESMDKPGRACIKFTDATSSSSFILGASSKEEAESWIANVNKCFINAGYTPAGAPAGTLWIPRTLSDMEAHDPNQARDEEGNQIPMPNGMFTNGAFTGPSQLKRTASGGLAVVGGGWKLSPQELGEREMQTLVGLPMAGYVFTDQQADSCGVPRGSVLIG